jgi:cytochrome c oxidase subunit III
MSEQMTALERDSYPSEQFEDIGQQLETATLGMWTFLATEVLFFGVMFATFYIYRMRWTAAFAHGANDLSETIGTINTAVLLGSSFCMAMGVHAASKNNRRSLFRWMLLTGALGLCFLGFKALEYSIDYREHLIPTINFSTIPPDGPPGEVRPPQEQLFMTLYFVMTLFHALHMIIGLGVLGVLITKASRGAFSAEYHNPIEIFGLYWHFVDIVWVFLFPTLYLLKHL